jgi:DNA-binding transcriptional LysR family regulator
MRRGQRVRRLGRMPSKRTGSFRDHLVRRQLGVTLFERGNRHVMPTPLGRRSPRALSAFWSMQRNWRGLARNEQGAISGAVCPALAAAATEHGVAEAQAVGRLAFKGETGILQRLIDAHCDVNARNGAGQTALMTAAMFGRRMPSRCSWPTGPKLRFRTRPATRQ